MNTVVVLPWLPPLSSGSKYFLICSSSLYHSAIVVLEVEREINDSSPLSENSSCILIFILGVFFCLDHTHAPSSMQLLPPLGFNSTELLKAEGIWLDGFW